MRVFSGSISSGRGEHAKLWPLGPSRNRSVTTLLCVGSSTISGYKSVSPCGVRDPLSLRADRGRQTCTNKQPTVPLSLRERAGVRVKSTDAYPSQLPQGEGWGEGEKYGCLPLSVLRVLGRGVPNCELFAGRPRPLAAIQPARAACYLRRLIQNAAPPAAAATTTTMPIVIHSHALGPSSSGSAGVGVGVGSGIGVEVGSSVGVGIGSGVGVAVGSDVGVGVGSGVAVGVGSGVAVGVGSGVGVAVGSGVAVGVGSGVGVAVGSGVAVGVGSGVGVGVGSGVGVAVGSGVAVGVGSGVAVGGAPTVTSEEPATSRSIL